MPYKDPKRQKEYQRDWYKQGPKYDRRKAKHNEYKRKRRKHLQSIINEWKSSQGCWVCDEDRHELLDAHHYMNVKNLEIADFWRRFLREEALKKELELCIPLCALHHRMIHRDMLCLIGLSELGDTP